MTTNGTQGASNSDALVPPQNLDAEENVLGGVLLHPHSITEAADILKADDFYRQSHGIIFSTAIALDAKGVPVDAITLADELERNGKLGNVGGKARIHELASIAPGSSSIPRYATIVRELSVRRRLVRAGMNITELGYGGLGELDGLLATAESELNSATSQTYASDFTALADGLDNFIETVINPDEQRWGTKTGFPDLDKITTGLYAGNLIVIAARPTVGKSVLAQNVGENVADQGMPTAFFSLEMSKEELLIRSLSRKCKLPPQDIRTNRLDATQKERIRAAVPFLKQRPFYVEDNATITVTELRSRARRMKRKHGLGVVIVDYLQLMVSEGQQDKRNDQIATITRSLKLLAKELEVPVIALSQLNRNLESRESKRPTLADLRESGAIEQDTDMVWFIYREELYKQVEAESARDAEIIIAKNRMGEIGTVKLLFRGKESQFQSPATIPGVKQ